MRALKVVSLLGVALLAAAIIASCREVALDDTGDAASTIHADVGVVLSLSGPIGVYGEPTRAGIELAITDLEAGNDAGGVTMSATFIDDAGDAQTGAEAFQTLTDQGVTAIIGPTLSNTGFVAHPVAHEAGIPVVAVTNTAAGITDIGDFIFRVSLTEADVIPQTVNAMAGEFGPATAALVFSGDDAWSRSSADAFRDAAAAHGIQIVIEQDIPYSAVDVNDAVQAIEIANPDVIMMSLLENTAIVLVAEVRARGMEPRLVCGNGCNSGSFIRATGEASEGLVVGAAWHIDRATDQSDGFIERYRDAYGVDPDQFSAQGYAGVQVVAEAIRRAGSTDHDAVRDALAGIEDFETVLGTFSFDSHRDAQHPAVIQIVQDGRFSVLR